MLEDLLLHPKTKLQLDSIIKRAPHGVLVTGSTGSGKQTVSTQLAAVMLNTSSESVLRHPYTLSIDPIGDSISIEEIRSLQQFLKLKVPTKKPGIHRIIIINNAERMRSEAQNALLKTLEEPPADTMIILTSAHADSLLPTITSRLIEVPILPVSQHQAQEYFAHKGISSASLTKAFALSQGQAGLLYALLSDESHPLTEQVEKAKNLLGLPIGQRLLMSDELSKDKQHLPLLLNAILRISHAALVQASKKGQKPAIQKWHNAEAGVTQTIEMLRHNPNTKLLLDNLFINL